MGSGACSRGAVCPESVPALRPIPSAGAAALQGSCAGKRLLVVFAYRSDKYAAVLTLQKTQRKDRRAYDGLYWNPCKAAAPQRKGRDRHHRLTGIS